MPGVVKIITAETLGLAGGVPCGSNPTGTTRQPRHPLLAEGRVRYHGEPVAMVIATDRYTARDAADAVLVDYDPQPAVTDARKALEDGAPRVHEEYDDNLCCTLAHETEGFAEAFAAGARIVKSQNYQPADHADRDGDPRLRRRLGHVDRRGDAVHVHAGAALRANVRGRHQRDVRVEGARGRARRRRRVRLEAELLPRGVPALRRLEGRRRAGEVDRGPQREHPRHHPRPRPVAVLRGRGRRPTARSSR